MTDSRELTTEAQVWRMHRSRFVLLNVVIVGCWTGCGVWLMFQGAWALAALGLIAMCIGPLWAWFQLWLPKAVITPSELHVVNHIRRHRIPLEDIEGVLKASTYVTFVLVNGKQVSVTAVQGWFFSQRWSSAAANHAVEFVTAVFKARDQMRKSTEH